MVIGSALGTAWAAIDRHIWRMQRPAECAACRMRALDLTSGRDKFSSPSQPLAATVPFGKQGTVTFNASQHWQRPGLTLFDGTVYAAFASHCDAAEFHPWIFALDAMSLQVYPPSPSEHVEGPCQQLFGQSRPCCMLVCKQQVLQLKICW